MLELYVLNGGIGETQIIHFPDGKWGLVDCFASPSASRSHAILEFMDKKKVSELEFVCLTHPHHDHYKGMKAVLEERRVKQFWRFGGMTGNDIKRYAYQRKTLALANLDIDPESDANELAQILAWPHKTENKGVIFRRLEGYQDLMEGTDTNGEKYSIRSIAPSSSCVADYEQAINLLFEEDKNTGRLYLKDEARKGAFSHNKVSVALVIEYAGRKVVILGGDVETTGWQRILDDRPGYVKDPQVVKVSHHGSPNGMPERFWDLMPAKDDAENLWAVITPYTRHNLPDQMVLSWIKRSSDKIFSTYPVHGGIRKEGLRLPDGLTSDQRVALLNSCKLLQKVNEKQTRVGVCHFKLFPCGKREISCTNGASTI